MSDMPAGYKCDAEWTSHISLVLSLIGDYSMCIGVLGRRFIQLVRRGLDEVLACS